MLDLVFIGDVLPPPFCEKIKEILTSLVSALQMQIE